MAQLQVLVVGNEIVPRDTPCVVAARSVPELGHQLRTRCVPMRLLPACILRLPAFAEWAACRCYRCRSSYSSNR